MISQALRDARRYEEVFEKMILPEEYIKGSTISFTNTTRTTRIGDRCTGDTP